MWHIFTVYLRNVFASVSYVKVFIIAKLWGQAVGLHAI